MRNTMMTALFTAAAFFGTATTASAQSTTKGGCDITVRPASADLLCACLTEAAASRYDLWESGFRRVYSRTRRVDVAAVNKAGADTSEVVAGSCLDLTQSVNTQEFSLRNTFIGSAVSSSSHAAEFSGAYGWDWSINSWSKTIADEFVTYEEMDSTDGPGGFPPVGIVPVGNIGIGILDDNTNTVIATVLTGGRQVAGAMHSTGGAQGGHYTLWFEDGGQHSLPPHFAPGTVFQLGQ